MNEQVAHFLIVGRETPVRTSSLFSMIHSCKTKELSLLVVERRWNITHGDHVDEAGMTGGQGLCLRISLGLGSLGRLGGSLCGRHCG